MWENWLTGTISTTANFTGEPGHTYHFSSRGTDRAMNKEAQHGGDGETNTTLFCFTWFRGSVSEIAGVPVSAMGHPSHLPAFTNPSDINGNYSAYLEKIPRTRPSPGCGWARTLPVNGWHGSRQCMLCHPWDNSYYSSVSRVAFFPDGSSGGDIIPP